MRAAASSSGDKLDKLADGHSFQSPALESGAPSMVWWLGSLDAVELNHQLQSSAASVKASPSLLFDVPTARTMHAVTVAGGGLSPVPLTSFASSKSLELKTSLAREPLGDSLLAASTSLIADGPLLTGGALLPRPSRSHLMPTD